jgi:hypothetical protein
MQDTSMRAIWVARGGDRFGEHQGLGISDVFFKVSTEDSYGGLLVVEMTTTRREVLAVTFTTNKTSGSM